jgi:hypothetical protein
LYLATQQLLLGYAFTLETRREVASLFSVDAKLRHSYSVAPRIGHGLQFMRGGRGAPLSFNNLMELAVRRQPQPFEGFTPQSVDYSLLSGEHSSVRDIGTHSLFT